MLEYFRENRNLHLVPDGICDVVKGNASFQPVYHSHHKNNIPALASGEVSAVLERDGCFYKAKRILLRDESGELLSDKQMMEGIEIGTYQREGGPEFPFALLKKYQFENNWQSLEKLAEFLERKSLLPPIKPILGISYNQLTWKKCDGLYSMFYELKDKNYDLRFNEIIKGLVNKLRQIEANDLIPKIERIQKSFLLMNKSRGAIVRLYYENGLMPSEGAITSDNYSIVSYTKNQSNYGLFFHDNDGTINMESKDKIEFMKHNACDIIPKFLLALSVLISNGKRDTPSFIQLNDGMLDIQLLEYSVAAREMHDNFKKAFQAGFNDYENNLQILPAEDLNWLIEFTHS